MKRLVRITCFLLPVFVFFAGCYKKEIIPEPTPVPSEGYIRQSYDIHGLSLEDNRACVYGLVLNTGTLDIAYIGFSIELCDSRGNVLYEQRYESVLYETIVPGDCFPFNCVFDHVFEDDADAIASVRIGNYVWKP